jgi:hypothetical protein
VGSVRVSEWGLEHTMRLRGEGDGEGEDTLTPVDCERARQFDSEETESVESQPNTLPTSATSAFRTPDKSHSGTTQGTPPPDSPFSLSCLGLPTTPITPTAAPPQLEGPMSWWAEALAETENMEDIDALVEQLEGTARGSSSVGGKDGEENSKVREKGERKEEAERVKKVQEGEEKKTEEADVTLTQNNATATGSAEENVSSITEEERRGGEERSVVPATEKQSGANSAEDQEVSSASAGSANPASHDQSVVTETTPITSRSPSPSTGSAHSEEVAYIVQAGRLVRKALQYEQEREFEEAFDLFKAAVDVLLNGVQTELSRRRRELVSQKTEEYLRYAEALHQTHLSSQAPPTPAPVAMTPHLLKDFKAIGLIGKVILVQSRHNQQTYVFKVLHKSLIALAAVPKGRPKNTVNRSPTQCPHMVQLLHHYETANHRVYLLLEHARGGRMVDLVAARRQQWELLRDAAINPPSSSSLVLHSRQSPGETAGEEGEEEEDDMEKMLGELTLISPPSTTPLLEDSLTEAEEGGSGSASSSLDTLAAMRRRLLETEDGSEGAATPPTTTPPSDTASGKKNVTAAINIEPPTPTTTAGNEPSLVGYGGSRDVPSEDGVDRLTTTDSLKSCDDEMLPSTTSGRHGDGDREGKGAGTARGKSPCFSPASLQNSPGNSNLVDDWMQRLEGSVKQWALQIITALEHLHRHGIICKSVFISLSLDSLTCILTYTQGHESGQHSIGHVRYV